MVYFMIGYASLCMLGPVWAEWAGIALLRLMLRAWPPVRAIQWIL